MGGGGGIFSSRRSPEFVAEKIRKMSEVRAAEFEAELADAFAGLLTKFNVRNSAEVQHRLEEIREALNDELEQTFDTLFGGSVAKHTYVDGISDVDSLLVLKGNLSESAPDTVLLRVSSALQRQLGASAKIEIGSIAITVTYADGEQIQLVPAIRKGEKLAVPSWGDNSWSTIDPQQFKEGLTKRNEECGGKLIPTLKLAKAVNATLPEQVRLSGYHIESMGVSAFRNYEGERTTVKMLPHFFERASELVLSPMKDRTGQSVHVDENLGEANSPQRQALSHMLQRIYQRMHNASGAKSRDRWLDLFGQ